MIRLTALVLPLVVVLAACGVDGEPVPPSEAPAKPASGFTISGSVEAGVSRTF